MPKPTLMVYNKTIVCQTMDDAHCIIAVISSEVAKFKRAADKTPLQRLFYVRRSLRGLSPARLPIALERGFGGSETTLQRYALFAI